MTLRAILGGGVAAACCLAWAAVSDFSPANAQEIQTAEDQKQLEAWRKLSDEEALVGGARNVAALGFAVHNYAAANQKLPPIAVPNAELPFERRLSGLVLLLPYIGERPAYISDENLPSHRKIHNVDQATMEQAKQLYRQIDLSKAWDAPDNIEAARTVFSVFLAPKSGPMRDKQGFAVSHFAFVRGFHGVDNGAYTEDGVALSDIVDGTSQTIGVGQIKTELGPWIAAGNSTSRFMCLPADETTQPRFEGPFRQGCLVNFVDASPYFLVTETITEDDLRRLTTRDDRDVAPSGFRYQPLDEEDRQRLLEYLKSQ